MSTQDNASLEVVAIDTVNLGDRSYVIGSGGSALVVDPQRDIDRVEEILADRGWSASHVIETHFHNDYVSGGLELARRTGAEYVVPSGMDIAFRANQVSDKAELSTDVGLLRVLLTPGHTPNHLSYAVNVGGTDLALFTGGSMLYGSVGRPDLLGPAMTEPLAHAQWNSMRRLRDEVSHTADLYPTHGFGSFCSATATVGTASTLAQQIASNPAFAVDEDTFVTELIAGLDAFPRYYAHMGPANQAGAGAIDLSLPKVATAADIAAAVARGEWVVDLRSPARVRGRARARLVLLRRARQRGHLPRLARRLGHPSDPGRRDDGGGRAHAARAGAHRHRPPGGVRHRLPGRVVVAGDAACRATRGWRTPRWRRRWPPTPRCPMLDLRRASEWADGHVEGAKHVPLHELRERMDEVVAWAGEQSQDVWVYCGSGFRASIGCSILEAAGVSVVHVDDDFPNAAKAGLPVTVPVAHETLGEAYAD